ncbi:hypothetical protein LCGC14_0552340 [marine sediment metagenome]|uniref:Uncharacterized protein n=1 Tax=marine sediment metagenome TaxID=412755 RepID=A0A0F9UAX1_9ZZZZ
MAKLIYAILDWHAPFVRPGIKRLMWLTRLSRRQIFYHLSALRQFESSQKQVANWPTPVPDKLGHRPKKVQLTLEKGAMDTPDKVQPSPPLAAEDTSLMGVTVLNPNSLNSEEGSAVRKHPDQIQAERWQQHIASSGVRGYK